ncbi:MAG: hypothetical protein GY896_00390 [Gammaproteobacteria bacterium]|nr:hypothetical protein [Gammaproteobacteria bacterium]
MFTQCTFTHQADGDTGGNGSRDSHNALTGKNHLIRPLRRLLDAYVGRQSDWAIPLTVFVGSPAYLDGYAALPLTRGLIDHSMSLGAAMAFMVSGSVVSFWGAIAISPALRVRPFLLYLSLAIAGSLATGLIYNAATW